MWAGSVTGPAIIMDTYQLLQGLRNSLTDELDMQLLRTLSNGSHIRKLAFTEPVPSL